MESMLTDPVIEKVIIISDEEYAKKADDRSGGVGTETQIISHELYSQTEQDKFAVVVFDKDEQGKAYLPTYYKSRIYIDLCDESTYADNFDKLLRWIYNKPLNVRPELGKKPSFLDENSVSLGTTASYKRTIDAIKNAKSYASGAFDEYLNLFVDNFERFRLDESNIDEDTIISNIESFIPFRNEFIQISHTVARYAATDENMSLYHRFFESLIPYMSRPDGMNRCSTWSFDNYKYIVHELFLYTIAIFIKHERFTFAASLLSQGYYNKERSYRNGMLTYDTLYQQVASLEKKGQETRRLSVQSDMIKSLSNGSGIEFNLLMQADFVMFMRASIDNEKFGTHWWPATLLYAERGDSTFEIFSRAESQQYFDKMKCLLNISNKENLLAILEKFKANRGMLPKWSFDTINADSLTSIEYMCTKP
jgi:hypothetical protein